MKIEKVGSQNVVYVTAGDRQFCVSYNTPVGYVDFTDNVVYITDKKWSNTTSKHLNRWRSQHLDIPEMRVPQSEISLAFETVC